MQNPLTPSNQRQFYLDWLRVLAFGLLIFYHTGMFFVGWEWHIKNNELSETLKFPMLFLSQWRMSLLFLISGAGVYFALGSRSGSVFLGERIKRILLPLLFGMLVIIPPQIYFERLIQGATFSYIEFYKTVFDFVAYPKGNFSWHHLWYLAYVFSYSLLCLPLFLYLRKDRNDPVVESISRFVSKPVILVLLPAIWLWVRDYFLEDLWPGTNNLVEDWANHYMYLSFFILGFVIMSHPAYLQVITAKRNLFLGLALFCVPIVYDDYWNLDEKYLSTPLLMLDEFINVLNRWLWILTILGFGRYYLNFNNRLLKYANEAVYPFYILHQTVIICIAYPMINWDISIGAKYIVISSATFIICLFLYELFIRRISFLRSFFGLSNKAKQVATIPKVPKKVAV